MRNLLIRNFFGAVRYDGKRTLMTSRFFLRALVVLVSASSLILCSFLPAPVVEHTYSDKDGKIVYHTRRDMLHGGYVSYYSNNRKKAEGEFRYNLRSGRWTTWDRNGKRRSLIDYELGQPKTVIFPKIDKTAENDSVLRVTKRLWRFAPCDADSLLFGDQSLLTVLQGNFPDGRLRGYADDELSKPCEKLSSGWPVFDSINQLSGYHIKEDFAWYGTNPVFSVSRILAICPVMRNARTGKETELCWFDYSEVEPLLVTTLVTIPDGPGYIHNLADLLNFRYFKSEIYKESNAGNRAVADYASGKKLRLEQERIGLSLVETENDLWPGNN